MRFLALIVTLLSIVADARRGGGGGRSSSSSSRSSYSSYRAPSRPTYRPPAYKPPVYRPPAYKPPAYRPPAYNPPAYKPPAYRPPAYKPPAYRPPAYRPPVTPTRPAYRPSTTRYYKKTYTRRTVRRNGSPYDGVVVVGAYRPWGGYIQVIGTPYYDTHYMYYYDGASTFQTYNPTLVPGYLSPPVIPPVTYVNPYVNHDPYSVITPPQSRWTNPLPGLKVLEPPYTGFPQRPGYQCNGAQAPFAPVSYTPNTVRFYFNKQYTVVMQKMMQYQISTPVEYSQTYVNKYYQRILGCDGWGHNMPFYVPGDYPQPWYENLTNLMAGVAMASVAGAAGYMYHKQ